MQFDHVTTASSETLAGALLQRLGPHKDALSAEWRRHAIAHLTVDDLLPSTSAHWLSEAFPGEDRMQRVRSLCESSYVAHTPAQLSPPLHELLSALQTPSLTRLLSEIIGAPGLVADRQLSASGLTSHGRGGYENPHLEASHDPQGESYCVLKAIYYLSPDWRLADGGQLELWEDGLEGLPSVTLAKFNRLTLVAMHDRSWHSINRVHARRQRRALVQSYYAPEPLTETNYRHTRMFRGRPDQSLRDLVLRCSQNLQSSLPRSWLP